MKWLIWKEYRLNRLILMVGAVLLVAPHVVALVLALRGAGPAAEGSLSRLQMNLLLSAVSSLMLSQFTLALLGGNAIACERADRSAEFLAYLPVARTRILAGKMALPLVTAATIWIPNLLILLGIFAGLPVPRAELYAKGGMFLGTVALTGLAFFCIGWLLSCLLESPTFSICGGLIAPCLVLLGLSFLAWWFGYPEQVLPAWYRGTCLVLGPACFAAGTWYYLRRVEP